MDSERDKLERKRRIEELRGLDWEIRSQIPDASLFPSENGGPAGFRGVGSTFFIGDQPSSAIDWPECNSGRRLLYGKLYKHGLADAHLTDFYKSPGTAAQLQHFRRDGPPKDWATLHKPFLLRELDLVQHGGTDEIATATPTATAIPRADGSCRLANGWLPLPGASSLGGVQAMDCAAVGFVQKINSDGSVGCAAGGSGGGSVTSRTYSYFWQGAVQAGAAGFAVNLPAAGSPSLISAGGTRPSAVLEWPASQSTYYAWFSFVLPPGYPANGTIGYTLETRSGDSTNYANVYVGVACSSNVLDNPTIVEASPLPITATAASARTVTSGSITPNSGGFPACSASQRVWINLRVDTNVASHVMTQPFDLVSALFSVQGSI